MSAANASSNYRAGTNVRGHVFRASYSPYDALTLQFTVGFTSLVEEPPGGGNSDVARVQFDAIWKF